MGFTEVALGKTEKENRKILQERVGKEVLINDGHLDWCRGKVLNAYGGTYTLKKMNKEIRRLHYHDLEQLLDVREDPRERKYD